MSRVRKMKLDIDLKELFGTRVDDRALREAIGDKILEIIRERTRSGKDKTGAPLTPPYSKAYKESLAYKVYGKTGRVNMTLTGDMLDTMDIIDQNSQRITIGWNDTTQNAKAFNHITGDTVPSRDFFGVTESELEKVRSEYEDALADLSTSTRDQETRDILQRALLELDTLQRQSLSAFALDEDE